MLPALLLLASAAPPAPPAAAAATLCARIAAITQQPAVARAHWGVAVTTLAGEPVCLLDADRYFRPASNAKLFTAAAALALLGPESTATTRVRGQAAGAEVAGDLVLVGAGDAYLTTRPMPYGPNAQPVPDPLAVLADAVVARGIRHVRGGVVGDDTAFPYEPYAPDWAADDLPWGYGAPVSALSAADNKTLLTVIAGPTPGSPAIATLNPPAPGIRLDNTIVTAGKGAEAAVQLERAPGSDLVHLHGTVAVGAPYTDDLAILDPTLWTATTLKTLLEARGVAVDGDARVLRRAPGLAGSFLHDSTEPIDLAACASHPAVTAPAQEADAPVLATHTSPTLAQDVAVTLKVSQNLHAELLLHRLGLRCGADGSTAQGVRVVRAFLQQAGVLEAGAATTPAVVLYDGSGLSGHDLATPRALVRLLAYASTEPWFAALRAALPVGGVDGSLASRFAAPALRGRVEAKTGTLGESRALSGFVRTAAGATLIVSVMVDNHAPAGNDDRTAMDRIVEAIIAGR